MFGEAATVGCESPQVFVQFGHRRWLAPVTIVSSLDWFERRLTPKVCVGGAR